MLLFYTETETAQFWIIIFLVAVFGLDIIRRIVFEGKSISNRLREREEEKSERIAVGYSAKIERERIAEEVKTTLAVQQAEVKRELKNQSQLVENALETKQVGFEKQIEQQFEIVESVLHKNKITTQTDLAGEAVKIKQAIDKSTESAKAAYAEANTINKKLAEMSEAGLIKMDEKKRGEVEEREGKKPEGKKSLI